MGRLRMEEQDRRHSKEMARARAQYEDYVKKLQVENQEKAELLKSKGLDEVFWQGYFYGVEQAVGATLLMDEMALLFMLRTIRGSPRRYKGVVRYSKDWVNIVSEWVEMLGIPNAEELSRKLQKVCALIEELEKKELAVSKQ